MIRLSTVFFVSIGLLAVAAPSQSSGSCFILGLDPTGEGDDPVAEPTSSPGCQFHEYHEGEAVTLIAQPDPGWEVSAWSGTDDDTSTDLINTITMPAALHFVAVDYSPICLALALGHTGMGADPVAAGLGDGSVWTRHHVASQCDALGLGAADIDGDGDLDALAGLSDVSNEVVWWENLSGDATSWTSHEIATNLNWPVSIDSADFDGDGDADVVAALLVDDQVLWWRNVNGDGTAWASVVVADPVDGARDVVAVDLDGDGDPDVLGASRDTDRILWWENVDDGMTWIEHVVATGFDGANSVAPADFDGDGDLDIAGASQNSDQIAWFENLAGNGTSWTTHIIQSGGGFDFAHGVVAADINGDGEPDIMASSLLDDLIRWWENLGQASAFLPHDIAVFDGAGGARAADVNLDGNLDVVSQSQEIVSWRNKDGSGTAWLKAPIEDPYINAVDVFTADFDGDGDTDVLASQEVPCGVDIWRNSYGGTCPAGTFEPKDQLQVVSSPAPGWQVAGWSGTEDDSSTELANLVKMPLTDHQVLVHYEEVEDLSLSLAGSCPGQLTLTIAGATPNAQVAVLAGNAGSETLAGGPCAGTELDLTASRLLVAAFVDGNGELELERTVGMSFCGRFLQALDTTTCGVSSTVQIP